MPTKVRFAGVNHTQLPQIVSDGIALKGLPQTAGYPDGYGDVASSVTSSVNNISFLPLNPVEGQIYNVVGFYEDTEAGGGGFIYDPLLSRSSHNGGTIIAPEAIAAWDGTKANVSQLLSWTGSGNGCYVRIYSGNVLASYFGCSEGSDSSASFNKAVSSAISSGFVLDFESMQLAVGSVAAFSVNSRLRITGNSTKKPVINLAGSSESFVFRLVSAGIDCTNIRFTNGNDIICAGDGSHPVVPSTLTANIDSVIVENCEFVLCRRAVNFFSSKTGYSFDSVKLNNNFVDGGGNASKGYCGFSVEIAKMNYAEANGNEITRIDASQAVDAGRPIQVGCGRAIALGNNNPPTDYTLNFGWKACDNKISNVTDSRAAFSGDNPEVGGIRVVSCYSAILTNNTIKNVLSTGSGVADDCEGIYLKSVRGVIANNTLEDAGLNGGAILIKGYPEQGGIPSSELADPSSYGFNGVCTGNTINNAGVNNSSGIAIYSSGWIVSDNKLDNCGGLNNRYAPIWAAASNLSGMVISNNSIQNSKGAYGILSRAYGFNISIKNNVIDGVNCSATGLSNQHSYGIFILNDDSSGFNVTDNIPLYGASIEGNTIRNLTKMTGFDRISIAVLGLAARAATDALTISHNKITSTVDVGVRLLSGTFTHVTIDSNDFRGIADVYSLSGSPTVTNLSAYDNAGWLYGELTVDPASVAAGAYVNIGNTGTMQDVNVRDAVQSSCSGSLNGLVLSASCITNGQIDFFLWNPTAVAVDVGSRTFRAKAVKFAS